MRCVHGLMKGGSRTVAIPALKFVVSCSTLGLSLKPLTIPAGQYWALPTRCQWEKDSQVLQWGIIKWHAWKKGAPKLHILDGVVNLHGGNQEALSILVVNPLAYVQVVYPGQAVAMTGEIEGEIRPPFLAGVGCINPEDSPVPHS